MIFRRIQAVYSTISSILNNHMQHIDATQVMSFARDNKDALLKLNATKEHKGEFSMECSGSLLHLWDEAQLKWEENQVTVAIDTDEVEEELVYGIAFDHVKKRIIVSFRGSETGQD
eukprot:scaffold332075_cov47-Attheya_sp.AAC.1